MDSFNVRYLSTEYIIEIAATNINKISGSSKDVFGRGSLLNKSLNKKIRNRTAIRNDIVISKISVFMSEVCIVEFIDTAGYTLERKRRRNIISPRPKIIILSSIRTIVSFLGIINKRLF
jgi:hypothetical protein